MALVLEEIMVQISTAPTEMYLDPQILRVCVCVYHISYIHMYYIHNIHVTYDTHILHTYHYYYIFYILTMHVCVS